MVEKNVCKKFEITKTIYSDSERSEQFLVLQNAFLTFSWRFNELEQFELILEKILGFRNMQEKLEKYFLRIWKSSQ